MADVTSNPHREQLHRSRWELLDHVNALTDRPLTVLSFVWVGLLVVDLTRGLGPALGLVSNVIWGLFVADFAVEFLIAPHKLTYLRHNWLTALALVLPAFRMLRLFRAFRALRLARAARPLNLVRLLTSVNRGLGALRHAMRHRGVGYVAALTLLVLFAGAAGMYAFENPQALRDAGKADAAGLGSYGEAVWWTAMVLTTMGSDYFPRTAEGRLLCWLLALYAFAVFGYLTATVASYFVGQDHQAGGAGGQVQADAAALREEIAALRAELQILGGELRGRARVRPAPAGQDGPKSAAGRFSG